MHLHLEIWLRLVNFGHRTANHARWRHSAGAADAAPAGGGGGGGDDSAAAGPSAVDGAGRGSGRGCGGSRHRRGDLARLHRFRELLRLLDLDAAPVPFTSVVAADGGDGGAAAALLSGVSFGGIVSAAATRSSPACAHVFRGHVGHGGWAQQQQLIAHRSKIDGFAIYG